MKLQQPPTSVGRVLMPTANVLDDEGVWTVGRYCPQVAPLFVADERGFVVCTTDGCAIS